jgi:hypothetical protein
MTNNKIQIVDVKPIPMTSVGNGVEDGGERGREEGEEEKRQTPKWWSVNPLSSKTLRDDVLDTTIHGLAKLVETRRSVWNR